MQAFFEDFLPSDSSCVFRNCGDSFLSCQLFLRLTQQGGRESPLNRNCKDAAPTLRHARKARRRGFSCTRQQANEDCGLLGPPGRQHSTPKTTKRHLRAPPTKFRASVATLALSGPSKCDARRHRAGWWRRRRSVFKPRAKSCKCRQGQLTFKTHH